MSEFNNDTYKSCQSFPPFPVCSGNGVCNTAKGVCVCQDGWSSIGAFASKDGVDCNINIVAVKSMQLVLVILSLLSILYTLNTIIKQNLFYKMKRLTLKGYLSDSTRVYPLWILSMEAFALVDGVYRYIYPLRAVGNDVVAVLLFYFYGLSYAFAVTNFTKIVVGFLYHYSASMPSTANLRMKREVALVKSSSFYFNILAIVLLLIPFLCFAFPNNEFEVGAAFHVANLAWVVTTSMFCSTRGVHTMIKLLEEHLKIVNPSVSLNDNKLELLLARLKKARFYFLITLPGPVVGWLLIGLSRSFSRQSTYFFSYLMINALIVAIAAINIIPTPSSSASDGSKDAVTKNSPSRAQSFGKNAKLAMSVVQSSNSGIVSPVNANNVDHEAS